MKVQLVVVQGKPEGKSIPLTIPRFRIGRGETCHLRPSSEMVSREHAEFQLTGDAVTVRDLGSRNGTLVNGKAVTDVYTLKHGDLVEVGPLTFAVQIEGAPAAKPAPTPAPAAPVAAAAKAAPAPAPPPPPAPAKAPANIDDVDVDDIESWLVSDASTPTPESPSGVYGGDTITISAFKDAGSTAAKAAEAPADDAEYERQEDTEPEGDSDDGIEDLSESSGDDDMPEEFIDESNPFYVKKKAEPEAHAPTHKQTFKDTSDAAKDILAKMMERRKKDGGK